MTHALICEQLKDLGIAPKMVPKQLVVRVSKRNVFSLTSRHHLGDLLGASVSSERHNGIQFDEAAQEVAIGDRTSYLLIQKQTS